MNGGVRTGRRATRLRLRDVVIPTAPILLALAYAVGAAVLDYSRARDYDDPWSQAVRLGDQLRARLAAAAALPRVTMIRERLDPAVDDPSAIRLLVVRSLWDREVLDTQRRGWVDATLVREGGNRKVEVRRRGDTSVHWTTPKFSITVRAPRGDQIRGFRELALTGKTVLGSQVAHTIAADFGLLVPFSTLAPVYLNEQFYGLFRAVEPIDESFLRRVGQMPGNVFRADRAERGEIYRNIPRNVFWNPYIWDRVAELNDPGADPYVALRRFLHLVTDPTLEAHLELMRLVDRDEIAALFAATLTVGDPYHLSGVHNQYWYEDPATGTLHPIPWDLRLRRLAAPPTNPLNPFLVAALRDPLIPGDVLRAIVTATEGGLLERAKARLDSITARFDAHLAFEESRAGLVSAPGEPDAALADLRENLATLIRWTEDARLGFATTPSPDRGGPLVLDLEVQGHADVALTGLTVSAASGALEVWADRDRDGRLGPGDAPVPVRAESREGRTHLVPNERLDLPATWQESDWRIVPGRAHYRLFLTGAADAEVQVDVVNAITGGTVEMVALEPGTALGATTGFHAWQLPTTASSDVILEGSVDLTEDLRIGPTDRLRIASGTTVRLAPDVSILARGQVEVRGEPGRPVRFLPADPELPWGSFILQGEGSSGSVLQHVEFTGGGGAHIDGVAYKGMVSVHGAQDVRLEDVAFADNLRSDDAFNAVHAEVHLDRCSFSNANGDAVDFDYSSGSITNCTFEDSRNDAIDLMTSDPLIRSNVMLRSGDKGVSIGEASSPTLIDNYVRGAARGIEIKDRSDPLILHDTIEQTGVGILLQVKNWRYAGGGRGLLVSSRLANNEVDLSLDADSRLAVLASRLGPAIEQSEEDEPSWVRRAYGLGDAPARPGAIGDGWIGGAVRGPLYELPFDAEAPFDETPVGWSTEGVARLRHRDRALRAAVERGAAAWSRPVDWPLSGPAEVTVEFTGRDLLGAALVLVTDDGEIKTSLTLPTADERVRLAAAPVPGGRIRAIRFEAEADPTAIRIDPVTGLGERAGGRLDVFRVRLYDVGGER